MRRIIIFGLVFLFLISSVYGISANITVNTTQPVFLFADLIDVTQDYGIYITADYVTVNCNGYNLDGVNKGIAIYSSGKSTSITNCNLTGWQYGIYFDTNATSGSASSNDFETMRSSAVGDGEHVYGVYAKANNTYIHHNEFRNFRGTNGDTSSNTGGDAYGIYFQDVADTRPCNYNNMYDFIAGKGSASLFLTNEDGGNTYGVFVNSSDFFSIRNNYFENFYGGQAGGRTADLGDSGDAFAHYVQDSNQITIRNSEMLNISGGTYNKISSFYGGKGNAYGTYLLRSNNTNISNNVFNGIKSAYSPQSCWRNTAYVLYENDCENNEYGNNVIQNISVYDGTQSILGQESPMGIGRVFVTYFTNSQNIFFYGNDIDNVISGGQTTGIIYELAEIYGLSLDNVKDSRFEDNNFSNMQTGDVPVLAGSQPWDSNTAGTNYGFYIINSDNNNFSNNYMENITGGNANKGIGGDATGIYISGSSGNNFTGNEFEGGIAGSNTGSARGGNAYGIRVIDSLNNAFIQNVWNCESGGDSSSGDDGNCSSLELQNSNSTTFSGNAIYGGSSQENNALSTIIRFDNSENNTFTDNRFSWFEDNYAVFDEQHYNQFSHNYWVNYSNRGFSDLCTDSDSDFFCDTETYILNDNNTDSTPRRNDLVIPSLSLIFNNTVKDHYENLTDTLALIIQASSTGTCSVVDGSSFWFTPSQVAGSDTCHFTISDNIRSDVYYADITSYDPAEFTVVGAPSYGGGTPAQEDVIVYNYVQNITFDEIVEITQEEVFGDKIRIVKETKAIEVRTDNYNNKFDISAIAGSMITKRIIITNVGEESVELEIYCLGDLCDNVDFDVERTVLSLDEMQEVTMTIQIPENSQDGEVFGYSIIVEDIDDEEFKASLPVKITIDPITGVLAGIFSIEKIFLQGWQITDDFLIPNIVIFILVISITFTLLTVAYNFSGKNIFVNLLRYFGTVAVMIAFLVFI